MNAEAEPTPQPRRIEWSGPNGWTVWMDEDGCHLRSRSGDSLEMVEVVTLFALWDRTRVAYLDNHLVPTPQPPTCHAPRGVDE